MNAYHVIGVMSGSSLDGVDIAYCTFSRREGEWKFRIRDAVTETYTEIWKKKLNSSDRLSGIDLVSLDLEYGEYLGRMISGFIRTRKITPDFIASHGHTVFHQPGSGLTLQIGHGAPIAAITGLTTISDFRSLDVRLGGQGAPLVPVGDMHLFPAYDFCLNLGGIANISYRQRGKQVAFDICPVNMAINALMGKVNKTMDTNGEMGRSGKIIPELLFRLNNLEYYRLTGPRSLGREWFESEFLPVIEKDDLPLRDILHTVYEHIAIQVSRVIQKDQERKVLVTGGGAFNGFLIERFRSNSEIDFVIPDELIIQYKEALVFAFMGVLRTRNEINCLASVTGARRDSVGGSIFSGSA